MFSALEDLPESAGQTSGELSTIFFHAMCGLDPQYFSADDSEFEPPSLSRTLSIQSFASEDDPWGEDEGTIEPDFSGITPEETFAGFDIDDLNVMLRNEDSAQNSVSSKEETFQSDKTRKSVPIQH